LPGILGVDSPRRDHRVHRHVPPASVEDRPSSPRPAHTVLTAVKRYAEHHVASPCAVSRNVHLYPPPLHLVVGTQLHRGLLEADRASEWVTMQPDRIRVSAVTGFSETLRTRKRTGLLNPAPHMRVAFGPCSGTLVKQVSQPPPSAASSAKGERPGLRSAARRAGLRGRAPCLSHRIRR
jgi:hypothetical protein